MLINPSSCQTFVWWFSHWIKQLIFKKCLRHVVGSCAANQDFERSVWQFSVLFCKLLCYAYNDTITYFGISNLGINWITITDIPHTCISLLCYVICCEHSEVSVEICKSSAFPAKVARIKTIIDDWSKMLWNASSVRKLILSAQIPIARLNLTSKTTLYS